MKRIIFAIGRVLGATGRATIALVGICGVVAALANYTMTQGSGTTFGSIVIGGTVHYAQQLICDLTTPSQCAAVDTHGQQLIDVNTTNNNLYAAINSGVGPVAPGTAATTSILTGGIYNSSGVALTNGQQAATQFDATGHLLTTNGAGDPCRQQVASFFPFSITTATTTNIVTGTAAKKIYVCYLYMQTAAANNVAVISGTTGATCGANTKALVGGTTAANGLNNAANGGQAIGNGGYSVLQVATANDDICIITSASTPLAGVIKYVVQ